MDEPIRLCESCYGPIAHTEQSVAQRTLDYPTGQPRVKYWHAEHAPHSLRKEPS